MTRKYKHTRFAGLVYLNQMPGLWRFVDVHDGMPKEGEAPRVVGPQYKTERELLADADRYARESWGYGATPDEGETPLVILPAQHARKAGYAGEPA
ncbi:hypothetical protein [Paraburkholderia sp. GAS32]|uniref:hypothetical protein n=1 Tax=Paraburkholderia sp. GAS32 TaxID=3035129 RepID=UPI003D19E83A